MIRVYCDICGGEMTSPVEERYELNIRSQDKWDGTNIFRINDMCRTCYLDIIEEIKRKQDLKDSYCDIDEYKDE